MLVPEIVEAGWVVQRMQQNQRDWRRVERLFDELLDAPVHTFSRYPAGMDASAQRGVYVICNRAGRPVHVGRTPTAKGGIAQRLCDHIYGRSSFVRESLNWDGTRLWRQKYRYQWLVVRSRRYRALLEAYAIGRLCPRHLGTGFRVAG